MKLKRYECSIEPPWWVRGGWFKEGELVAVEARKLDELEALIAQLHQQLEKLRTSGD